MDKHAFCVDRKYERKQKADDRYDDADKTIFQLIVHIEPDSQDGDRDSNKKRPYQIEL